MQKRLSSDLTVLSTVVQLYYKNESGKTVVKTTTVQISFVKTADKFSGGVRNALLLTLSELQDKTDFTLKAT